MSVNTKVIFEVSVAMNNGRTNKEVKKEEFTLAELGYNPYKDNNLSEFLEMKWSKWKEQYIIGGYSIEL